MFRQIQVNTRYYLLHNHVCGYESAIVTVINKRRKYVPLMYAEVGIDII